ncbi:MAG: acetyl-CoA decarbonylase/synthase complex subunit gamma [Candidatus Omnitrophota bacterium]
MGLSGLGIYKLLPKTNCRKCGFPTCLAFAMQLAKKAVGLDKCPQISAEAKASLEASSQPAIRLISIGQGERELKVGNENVMFRHEEKFFHPAGIGVILEDSLEDEEALRYVSQLEKLKFERIGQEIRLDIVALRHSKRDAAGFAALAEKVVGATGLALVLRSFRPEAIKAALDVDVVSARRPLIYAADKDNYEQMAAIAQERSLPLAVKADGLEALAELSEKVAGLGVQEIVLDSGAGSLPEKIWQLTQIRRLALKKKFRPFGFPAMAVSDDSDSSRQVIEAAAYILKYAGIVLLNCSAAHQILPLLTLRQNIYSDPQKPLQVEAKAYAVGAADENSPVLVTTNFSLTYYTVLGEVEASKVAAWLVSVDTEGMSVLTAWAAEKFTPEKIATSLEKFGIADKVRHKNIIIPGYVAVLSGDLEEKSQYKVIVGPREAAGITGFLRNL